jgi:hypothetical protein
VIDGDILVAVDPADDSPERLDLASGILCHAGAKPLDLPEG